jgi:hypothetical protein
MLSSTYQRVGALAGLLLVVGAWLSGYYQHWLWPVLTIGLVLVTYWVALGGLVDNETNTRVSRGFMVGVVSGVVARILGMLAMVWAFDSWSTPVKESYDSLSDLFRVLFNGNVWASILAIAFLGVVGAFVAYTLPYFTAEEDN